MAKLSSFEVYCTAHNASMSQAQRCLSHVGSTLELSLLFVFVVGRASFRKRGLLVLTGKHASLNSSSSLFIRQCCGAGPAVGSGRHTASSGPGPSQWSGPYRHRTSGYYYQDNISQCAPSSSDWCQSDGITR